MTGKMRNCSTCGRIFLSINSAKICVDCRAKEEEIEKEIVSYVREHPKTHIKEIVEETGASESIIRRLIREGRFLGTEAQLDYPCDHCGEPIQKGKFCDKCTAEMTKEIEAHAAKANGSARPTAQGNAGANKVTTNRKGYVTLQKR